MPSKKTTPIYIKLEHGEALGSKRSMLSSEGEFLRLIQIIKRYRSLRFEELKLKKKLHRKSGEIIINMRKIQNVFPEIKLPKILKKEESGEVDELKEQIEKTKLEHDRNIELQLRDIQQKLRELQRK